jgi:hypothetical protein
MPYPRPGEKRSDYIQRAVQTIKAEEPDKPLKAVLGKAYGLWREYSGKGKKKADKWT